MTPPSTSTLPATDPRPETFSAFAIGPTGLAWAIVKRDGALVTLDDFGSVAGIDAERALEHPLVRVWTADTIVQVFHHAEALPPVRPGLVTVHAVTGRACFERLGMPPRSTLPDVATFLRARHRLPRGHVALHETLAIACAYAVALPSPVFSLAS
jgi:hypothetical protein